MNQLQSFGPNTEMYNLTSGMEMIGFLGKSMNISQQNQQQQNIMQDGLFREVVNMNFHQGYFEISNSKYLGPAQDLLNELCNLGINENGYTSKTKTHNESESCSSRIQPLESYDLLELQKRQTKLLQMLEKVDRRYKNYCNQMKAVVSTFEAVAGKGAANVYSSLASRAMSRHFRCLRDGIIGQIKVTKKALGEKDYVYPGTTRGETPGLRVLDQNLRQQKALHQQMNNVMESHPWRPQRGLPERSVFVLRAWLFEHFLHPYPSDVDKHILARQTGLSRSQVSNWFINARVRLWKPMVEEMYLEETKEQENLGSPNGSNDMNDMMNCFFQNQNPQTQIEDQKPNLVRLDSECISSITNNPAEKNDSYLHSNDHHWDGLTLGLQQHDAIRDMGLTTFSQASQFSIFYTRDHITDDENCQQVEYSLLDSENHSLPYRNLMGAHDLLHDLAG